MKSKIIDSLNKVDAVAWNKLNTSDYPFLRHEYLFALERNQCLSEATGWYSQHIVIYDDNDVLVAAMPLYIKDNSFGEFVFDWSWADAYQRHGFDYYPKLVCAIPFTPATGSRFLCSTMYDRVDLINQLVGCALRLADRLNCSSFHCLFPDAGDQSALRAGQGLMFRTSCQFHWQNQDYADFAEFLASLTSKRRKNIRRERRLVNDADIRLQVRQGHDLTESDWHHLYQFYCNTFDERGRSAPLTLEFFLDVGATMGEQMVLVQAYQAQRCVAGSVSYMATGANSALFGRHWGCLADFDSLHFEVCYYQNLEFCIEQELRRFEPGVQGEHKVWRGFLPTLTYSAHWLAQPDFSQAIADFLRRETPAVEQYAQQLQAHSPYNSNSAA